MEGLLNYIHQNFLQCLYIILCYYSLSFKIYIAISNIQINLSQDKLFLAFWCYYVYYTPNNYSIY